MADCGCSTKHSTTAENKEAPPFQGQNSVSTVCQEQGGTGGMVQGRETPMAHSMMPNATCGGRSGNRPSSVLPWRREGVYSDVRTSSKPTHISIFAFLKSVGNLSVHNNVWMVLLSLIHRTFWKRGLAFANSRNHRLKQTLLWRD